LGSLKWSLFARSIRIRDTLNIKNDGNTSNNPLLRRILGGICLQLGGEDISNSSSLGLIDWTFVGVLVFFTSLGSEGGYAMDDGNN
jgi:hypothetical protein